MTSTRWLLFVIAVSLLTAAARADDLTTSGGKKLSGKLVSVDKEGVTFISSETQVKVAGKDIVVLDFGNTVAPVPRDPDSGKDLKVTEIELSDGSVFRCARVALKARTVETEQFPGPKDVPAPRFQLPMTALFSIMRDAGEPRSREAWKKMLASRGKRDMYVMRDAENLNFVQGTILGGSENGREVNFENENGTRSALLLSRATGGLVFAQLQPAQVPPTLCKVFDAFGNTLIAQSVEVRDAGIVVKTVSGVEVVYGSKAALVKLDYNQGNVAFLSDLDPQVDAPEVSPGDKGLRLNLAVPFVRDQGLSGEPLKLGTDSFPKGLVIASDTILTFNINGDYRDFKAVVGLPDGTPDANLSAKVTIEADGRVLFSESIQRKDKPRGVALDVKGVKQLRVAVEGDFGVNGNRVVLADARVQK